MLWKPSPEREKDQGYLLIAILNVGCLRQSKCKCLIIKFMGVFNQNSMRTLEKVI